MRKSTGAYPPDWPQIAQAVKDAAGWCCVRCGHPDDPEAGYRLTVHHLDGQKNNCAWHNLAALCQRCHLTIQGKVIMGRPWLFEHSEWFKPFVAGYTAKLFGLPNDKEYVLRHIDKLISLNQGRTTMEEYER